MLTSGQRRTRLGTQNGCLIWYPSASVSMRVEGAANCCISDLRGGASQRPEARFAQSLQSARSKRRDPAQSHRDVADDDVPLMRRADERLSRHAAWGARGGRVAPGSSRLAASLNQPNFGMLAHDQVQRSTPPFAGLLCVDVISDRVISVLPPTESRCAWATGDGASKPCRRRLGDSER